MDQSSPNRGEIVPVLILGASLALGSAIVVVGFLLQINVMGHGGFSGRHWFGFSLLFVGPGIALAGGVACLLTTRTVVVRLLGATQSVCASILVIGLAVSFWSNRAAEVRHAEARDIRMAEMQQFNVAIEAGWRLHAQNAQDVVAVGVYESPRGWIVDAIVVAPGLAIDANAFEVHPGGIERVEWVRLTDPSPLMPEDWMPPSPDFVEQFGDGPAYAGMMAPPDLNEQPLRRTLLLSAGDEPPTQLTTPLGIHPLPTPTEQPLAIVYGNPNWRDVATPTNRRYLP